ncbi:MAG: sulfatase-like hydrolase/transferase [Thermomicrobiales bacterium]
MKRRELLRASTAVPAVAAGSLAEAEARNKNRDKHKNRKDRRKKRRKDRNKGGGGGKRDVSGMNVLVFITDQERAIMHFPRGWEAENMPAATRLRRHGLTFNQAFCNACMCSPSRATLLTGYFPAQHGVKDTLEENMPDDQFPQTPLPLDLPNLGTVMSAAGYSVPYKGKWHLSKPIVQDWTPEVVNQYGFERWNPPDAGANQDLDQFGGGDADNDGRYMDDDGPAPVGKEGVIEYLKSDAAKQEPFFLIVSLVNPHDVLAYPKTYEEGGYHHSDTNGDIELPQTVDEDLSTKPTAQRQFLAISNLGLGPLENDEQKREYLNFYGNLMIESDKYLEDILDTLEHEELLDTTIVIKTSDHGEMGVAHGGQRQKMFNFYEETLRVPLTFSNPKLYPKPLSSNAMVSHVDFLPTMASLFKAPSSARADWEGRDYSRLILDPKKKGVQDYVAFTYDDSFAGQPTGPYVQPPQHIISIREQRYKLAKYYDPDGNEPEQWEMYDLKHDPLEVRNLAAPGVKRNKKQEQAYRRLKARLAEVERERLQPL